MSCEIKILPAFSYKIDFEAVEMQVERFEVKMMENNKLSSRITLRRNGRKIDHSERISKSARMDPKFKISFSMVILVDRISQLCN